MSTTLSSPDASARPNPSAPGAGATMREQTLTDDPDLMDRIETWFKASRDHWQRWRQEAAECYDFVAGNQWSEEDLDALRDQMRPAVTFNRIGPFVDSVSGLEINNRQDIQYIPRQLGASGVNDLLTSAAQWVRQECDAEDEESESFLDAVICGIGCAQTRMDYDDNPDGLIVVERIDPMEIYPDPSANKSNLADSRFVIRCKDVPIDQAAEMFPDVEEQDLHARWAEDQPDSVRQPHNARLAPYYRVNQAGEIDRERSMVRLVEVEWWEWERAYRVLDPASGRLVRMAAEKARQFLMRAGMLGIKSDLIRDKQKVFYKAIVGNRVLLRSDGAEQGGFSYKFITGKRDRNHRVWYGLVRPMRDPQMWANKWLSQSLHIVNTNAKGGLLAEEDAFVDPAAAENTWASADSITWLNPGGLGKVKQKEPPAFPAAISQLMSFAVESIPQITGISPEMMGMMDRTQPGVVEMQRKQQGMTVLARLFDAKRRYQKEQGRLMLWMIQTFISDGRLIRIGGPEQGQYVPLVHTPGLAQYDVIVEDAPTSPNMKERVWATLMQMFPMLRGMPLPPQFMGLALKYSPLPAGLVAEVDAMLQQPPPMNPQMQAAQQRQAADAAYRHAQAQHVAAQAQALPLEAQARIEGLRANAIAALAKVGLAKDSLNLDQAQAAVDALLGAHQQAMGVQQQHHTQNMDRAKLAQGLLESFAGNPQHVPSATNLPGVPPVPTPSQDQG